MQQDRAKCDVNCRRAELQLYSFGESSAQHGLLGASNFALLSPVKQGSLCDTWQGF